MKKVHLLFMVIVLTLSLQSYLHDDKTTFDLPAAERIEERVADYKAPLESSGDGWVMQYYMGRNYSHDSYTLLLKFESDHVTAMGDAKDVEAKTTLGYGVVKDLGPTLSFNEYNAVIHPLAETWLGSPDSAQGDYEFFILRATNGSIFVRGRKWHNDMVLTRLPKDTNWKEYMLGLITITEGMDVEAYNLVLGDDTLGQGALAQKARRLTAILSDKKWRMPYCTTDTGIAPHEPIIIGNRKYQRFIRNDGDHSLIQDDLKVTQFLSKSHKSVDFWVGEWQLEINLRRRIRFTSEEGSVANTPKGKLNVSSISYEILLTYDSAMGHLEFPGQPVTDSIYRYSTDIAMIPTSQKESKLFGEGKGSLSFTWDEDMQRTKAEGSGQITGHAVDSFFDVVYGEDPQPVTDAQGSYVLAFILPNIQYIAKIN